MIVLTQLRLFHLKSSGKLFHHLIGRMATAVDHIGEKWRGASDSLGQLTEGEIAFLSNTIDKLAKAFHVRKLMKLTLCCQRLATNRAFVHHRYVEVSVNDMQPCQRQA